MNNISGRTRTHSEAFATEDDFTQPPVLLAIVPPPPYQPPYPLSDISKFDCFADARLHLTSSYDLSDADFLHVLGHSKVMPTVPSRVHFLPPNGWTIFNQAHVLGSPVTIIWDGTTKADVHTIELMQNLVESGFTTYIKVGEKKIALPEASSTADILAFKHNVVAKPGLSPGACAYLADALDYLDTVSATHLTTIPAISNAMATCLRQTNLDFEKVGVLFETTAPDYLTRVADMANSDPSPEVRSLAGIIMTLSVEDAPLTKRWDLLTAVRSKVRSRTINDVASQLRLQLPIDERFVRAYCDENGAALRTVKLADATDNEEVLFSNRPAAAGQVLHAISQGLSISVVLAPTTGVCRKPTGKKTTIEIVGDADLGLTRITVHETKTYFAEVPSVAGVKANAAAPTAEEKVDLFEM